MLNIEKGISSMFSYKHKFQQHWFKINGSSSEVDVRYINERALRARAGLMFLVPVILLFIRLDHGDHNELITNAIDGITVAREYSHTFAHALIFFVMYEMVAPMFAKTAHLSMTSLLGAFFTRKQTPIYQTMRPKVFAWSIGLVLAVLCQISLYYTVMQSIAFYFLATCLLFMWLETACGICAGCYLYSFLVRLGIFKNDCEDCVIEK